MTFDHHFNFRQHVPQTCRCCFFHIRDTRRIRRNMSLLVAKPIATALVDNVFDFCNPLLPNIASKDIAKLQRIQYCLARVVSQSPRFSRPVPRQKSLHWLPVRFCITFKICTITYQTLPSKQPSYLLSMLPTAQTALIVKLKFTCCYRVKTTAGTRTRTFSVATYSVEYTS